MSKTPTVSLSAMQLKQLKDLIMKPPHWIIDPVDMDHILQIDPLLGKQLTAQRLETQAEMHRALADGAAKAAKLMK